MALTDPNTQLPDDDASTSGSEPGNLNLNRQPQEPTALGDPSGDPSSRPGESTGTQPAPPFKIRFKNGSPEPWLKKIEEKEKVIAYEEPPLPEGQVYRRYALRKPTFEPSAEQLQAAAAAVKARGRRRRRLVAALITVGVVCVAVTVTVLTLRWTAPAENESPVLTPPPSTDIVENKIAVSLDNRTRDLLTIRVGNNITTLGAYETTKMSMPPGSYAVTWTGKCAGTPCFEEKKEAVIQPCNWIFEPDISGENPKIVRHIFINDGTQ